MTDDPRPVRLSPLDLSAEVAAVKETDDIFRVYRPEWVIVHTIAGDDPADLLDQAHRHAEHTYAGRVKPEHIWFDVYNGADTHHWVHLHLLKPNLKGEFKTLQLARGYVTEQDWTDAEIVVRNSKRDHEIRSVGVKKL
jgi:hypothetical protein